MVQITENGRTQVICDQCWDGYHDSCPLIGCDCDCNYDNFYDDNENETMEKDGYA